VTGNLLHSGGWLFYLAAASAFLAHLSSPRPWIGRVANWILGAGFAGHSICFVVQAAGGGIPFQSRALALSLLAWGIVGGYLVSQRKAASPSLGAFVAPLATVLSMLSEVAPGAPAPPKGLPEWWLAAHIGTLVLGYAAFAVSFCVAIVYLIQEHYLKARRFGALFRRLPSLDALDRLNQSAIVSGFALMSVGLAAGAAWAAVNPRPGYRIWADPQVLFACVLWAWYAFAVQSRFLAGWRGRKYAFFSLIGFAVMVASVVGIGLSTTFHLFS
jgi:ABC-type uncharacterized transport system permease subunit